MSKFITFSIIFLFSSFTYLNAGVLAYNLDADFNNVYQYGIFTLSNTSDSASITSMNFGYVGNQYDVFEASGVFTAGVSTMTGEALPGDNNDGQLADFAFASFSSFVTGDTFKFLIDHDGLGEFYSDNAWLNQATMQVTFDTGETLNLFLSGSTNPSRLYSFSASATSSVPEPSTYAMVILGLLGLGVYKIKKNKIK